MNGPKHKLCTKLSSTYLRKWWITIAIGAILIIGGVLVACQFTALINAVIDRTIALRVGTKTFGWWAKPPVEPKISLYVYNVTNADDFLSNGSKAIVDEVGPYVYSETWEKVNIVENDNGTLSYNLRKIYKFREDLSVGPEDDVVIVPNIPMLSATSQSKHAARFLRLAMASIMDILKIKPFVQVSVGQLLWGYEDPLLKLAKDVVPKEQKLPYEEFGLLYGKNGTSSDRVTVFTGTDDIKHYGIIDRFNGRTHLPHWTSDECNRLDGTDGSIFPPHIEKSRILEVYDKDLCRLLPLVFDKEVMTNNEVPAYRFTPPEWVFADVDSRPENMCYCPAGKPSCSPNGLFNVSLCQYDSPIMLSFPHFYLADDSLRTQVEGISPPNKEDHQFFFDVQPKMGTTLRVSARIQINLAVSQVFDIKQVANFPDIIFPILWFEEGIEGLPNEVTDLMRFAETIPPKIRVGLIIALSALGVALLVLSTFCLIRNSHRQSTLHLEGSNYLATAQVDMNKKQNKDNAPGNQRLRSRLESDLCGTKTLTMANYCFWLKIVSLSLFCALNLYLFIVSCGCNYQDVVAREHIKFRQEMPTMDSWINSPFGKLKSYLFNVTNAEDFLSGKDSKVRLEQVGPITYHILGYNDIINRTKDSVTYNKHRYRHVKFMPEESVSPDILNKTIVQFNSVLLGAAAQTARSYISIATIGFDAVTVNEPLFLSDSIYYFLWEFTRPSLQVMSTFLPLSSNCGPLHNALKEKEEVFKVNIGTDHGVDNFFRIQTLNDEQLIKEQSNRIFIDDSCPINVEGAHDNSLFPPNIKKNTSLNIVASESCRILPLHYQREEELDGINAYRYALLLPNETAPECLSVTNGVRLPKGMFDVSKCVINDAPAAFSMPHFYGSSYDWTEHFEGLNPNAEEHEGNILLEPTTGIPIKENYRFQSNTIMPNMRSYSQPRLKKLSYMIVPTFWYEFELDRLPGFVTFLIRLDVKVLPVLQPILMALMLLGAAWSLYALIRLRRQLCHKICTTDVQLETVLNQHPQAHPTLEHVKE
ncbi:uncharacterized protein LOC132794059 [Drosophila nasuta]|uniref:uncharacterized protein LOC132794059 n=1 Tax=Drosophila nasuta TaxID=42062 RepID=UPI00295E5E8B|nr:uncharacterized protein LOC132794059 [Drosophila nasuta]